MVSTLYKKLTMDSNLKSYTNEDYFVSEYSLPSSYVSYLELNKIITNPIIKKYTKIFLLHPDETVYKDISEYITLTGSIEKQKGSGQRRSTSLTFVNSLVYKDIINDYKTYGTKKTTKERMWNPLAFNDDFHNNVKIKIVSCIDFNNEHYEIDEGIFVTFDPKMSDSAANNSLTIQLYDKFALLDGTIDGKGELDYEIPAGTSVYEALRQLLKLPKNKKNEPYDVKDIIFPLQYKNALLAYTIKKTSENSIGDLIKEIAQSIACDVGYNAYGNLEIEDSIVELDYHNQSIIWNYDEYKGEYANPSMDIKYSQIKNKVIVVGANINGYLCKGFAENTNPNSLYNIYGDFGVKSIKITDNLIPSNKMCEERAKYELKKYTQNYISISIQSIWIPYLEPGNLIRWSKKEWGIENKEFIVNSISLPLNGKDMMSITMTNLDELSR